MTENIIELLGEIEKHINSLQDAIAEEFKDVGVAIFNAGEMIGGLEKRICDLENCKCQCPTPK